MKVFIENVRAESDISAQGMRARLFITLILDSMSVPPLDAAFLNGLTETLNDFLNNQNPSTPQSFLDEKAEILLKMTEEINKMIIMGQIKKARSYLIILKSIEKDIKNSKRYNELKESLNLLDDQLHLAEISKQK